MRFGVYVLEDTCCVSTVFVDCLQRRLYLRKNDDGVRKTGREKDCMFKRVKRNVIRMIISGPCRQLNGVECNVFSST